MSNNQNSRIDVSVTFTPEFGSAFKALKVVPGVDAESIFKNVLSVIPKYVSKTWEAVEFCVDESFVIID